MRYKRANGERVGTVPYGYRLTADGVHIETEPTEQATLCRVQDLKESGLRTRRIAAILNQEGLRTRRGTDWRFQYVAAALRVQRLCRKLTVAA